MRENAATKGRRYLTEARLTVTRVTGDFVAATCRGAGTLYELGHDRDGWWCNCPARSTCAHLHALQAVTVTTRHNVDAWAARS